MTFERGSYDYMAPEIFNNKDYDEAVDVYSMGISIHEILVRRYILYVDEVLFKQAV